jgi:hypothetical protein
MARKNPRDYLDNIYAKYVVAPVMVILGMLIVGSIIDGALNTHNAFKIILVAAGGIGIIGKHFSKFWKHKE